MRKVFLIRSAQAVIQQQQALSSGENHAYWFRADAASKTASAFREE
jgi:hypothetical protein